MEQVPSGFFQKLRFQYHHRAFDFPLYLAFVISKADAFYFGAAFQRGRGASDFQIFDEGDGIAFL